MSGQVTWSLIYGRLATACGWTYPQIDEMTLQDVTELFDYWADHPPIHEMVAAYLGIPQRHRAEERASDLTALITAAPEARSGR